MSRYSLMNNLQTGNIILDMMISSFILAIIHNIIYNCNDINIFLKKFFERFNKLDDKIQLSFNCTERKGGYFGSSMTGSDTFKAILYHIRNKIAAGETKELNFLREYVDKFDLDRMYDDRQRCKDDNIESNIKEIIYMPDQFNKFKLVGSSEIDIYFKISEEKLNEGKNSEIDSKKYESIYTLNLIGDRKKVSEKQMQQYIDRLQNKYDNIIRENFNNNQYVFQYEGNNDDKNTFKIFPFYTTCNLDKLWFDGKEELIKKIDFFVNNKEWYEEKGKPYTPSNVFKTPLKLIALLLLDCLSKNKASTSSINNILLSLSAAIAPIKVVSSMSGPKFIIEISISNMDAIAKINDVFPVPGIPSNK